MNYAIQNNAGLLLGKKVVPTYAGTTDVLLERNELFRLDGDQRDLIVKAVEGRIWLTQTGDPRDIILEKGQTFQVDRSGLVLLQGLPAARLRFTTQALTKRKN